MIIDSATLNPTSAYKLLIGSILPRAIGWVSTQSEDGVANLAPISFFTAVGRKPPMVSLSLQPRSDGVTLKDTFVNIRDTGEFVVNMVTLPQAHAMHRSAFEFASDIDEFAAVGLEKEPSVAVRPPRVKDAPIALECKLDRIIPIGDLNDHVVFGEVVRFHIRDDVYSRAGASTRGRCRPSGASRRSTRSCTTPSRRPWTSPCSLPFAASAPVASTDRTTATRRSTPRNGPLPARRAERQIHTQEQDLMTAVHHATPARQRPPGASARPRLHPRLPRRRGRLGRCRHRARRACRRRTVRRPPGMGARAASPAPTASTAYADDVATQIRALARPVVLVGHSMGAQVAELAAAASASRSAPSCCSPRCRCRAPTCLRRP
jgi:flavin reductase (DIM6/NTAB) family NADH-FMN oxidoreductase RutF